MVYVVLKAESLKTDLSKNGVYFNLKIKLYTA
jgi:hypothetical protein